MKRFYIITLLAFLGLNNNVIAQDPNFLWAKQMGGVGSEYGNGIAIDASGNVYTTGYFNGTVDFDPGTGVYNLTSATNDIFVSKLDASGNFVWAKQMGGVSGEVAYAIFVDPSGNVYTTGFFNGTTDFDPGPGTYNLTSLGNDIFISKLDASGNFIWAKQMSGAGSNSGASIAVDASGNVYTTGFFWGTTDFDPDAATYNFISSGGGTNNDIFVSKLDALGNFIWAKQMGGPGDDRGQSIAVDGNGNVYTTGYFTDVADFDPGLGIYNLSRTGGNDIFVSKLDASGSFIWTKQMGGGSSSNQGTSIAVNASGNIYTTGYSRGTADFDPSAGTYNLTSAGSYDIFVSKLDVSGNFIWAKEMGGGNDDYGYSIAVDATGNVYTTGSFYGSADFDPGTETYNLNSFGLNPDVFVSKLDASGNFIWAQQMGGSISETGTSLAVDANENVYTTGFFSSTADFDPGSGTYNLTSAGGTDIFVVKLGEQSTVVFPPNFLWAKQLGGASGDYGNSVAVDINGNVYTTGYFSGIADFDPGTGIYNLTSAGSTDIFVSKLDASGNFVWAKRLGGASDDHVSSIAINSSGNVHITGYFPGTVDFDPGTETYNLVSAGAYDAFVVKLDASGNFLWAKPLGGVRDDYGYSIAVDANGNVYTTGSFSGTADFDPGTGTYNLNNSGDYGNAFVCKLDASGNFVLAKQLGGNSDVFGHSIAIDIIGNIYTTGYFWSTADFDPGTGTYSLISAGDLDIFVSKLDPAGNFVWAKQFGGVSEDYAYSIAVDANENVYTTGFFDGTADFDPGTGTYNLISPGTGDFDIFVSKLDASGNFIWAKKMGGTSNVGGKSIAIDASGNVNIIGSFSSTADFDPGPGTYNLTSVGNSDIFVSKLDASGNFLWAKQMGGTNNAGGKSIAIDASGNVYATGQFNGMTDFDPGSGTYNLTSAGGYDIFVVKLSGTSLALIYPKLSISTSSINAGQSVPITGTDFKHNGAADISIQGPGGFSQSINNISTNAQGGFIYNYPTATAMPLGLYNVVATDIFSGLTSPVRSFNLAGTSVTNYLQIVYPTIGLTFSTNQNINIEWKDKLVLGNNYIVVGSKRNYKYTVEYSDNGGAWQNIGTVQGQDYINTYVSLSKAFTYSAASNNMRVRITDFYNSANVKTSDVFIVNSATATNIQVNLDWDFSYPNSTAPVQGVSADGTARIFMNLSKITPTGLNIASVSVALSDAFNGTNATKLGRVKVATQTAVYGSEANGIATISATDNTPNKNNYIFWYVAPDDFVGNDIQDSTGSYRYVTALFSITYSNSTTATFTKKIKIVRPPLMLVHGLGGDASTWDDFAHTDFGPKRKFTDDYRFVTCKAVNIKPNAAFKDNALELTINSDPNTFQGVINDIRNQGYAANRVDYVCHSMGGCVLRSIFDNYYPLFTRTGTYANRTAKNYERGYVNKVIMIDVPNNSSPWADITNRYVGDLPLIARIAIQSWYGFSARELTLPLMFIKPTDPNAFIWSYEPTEAVRDLQIDHAEGGVNFGLTNTKAHLIAGDFFPGTQFNTNGLIPQQVINYVKNTGDDMTQKFLNYLLKIASNLEIDPQLRAELLYIIENNVDPVVSALDFLNKMALVMDAFNTGTFIPESDLVVSVQSQLAGHSKGDPNCSSFDNFVGHAFFRPVTKNIDVGNRVNYLLNSSINSSLFDVIGATSNRVTSPANRLTQLNNNVITSRRDTSKLQIISPLNNSSVYVDSILHIKLKVNDTTNLRSLEVNFQNKTYKIDSIILGIIDLNVQINSNILDTQQIVAEGFYYYQDSAVFVYDQAKINTITTETLMGFGVNPDILYLFKNQYKYPDYYAIYPTFATTNGNFSPYISAVVNDTSIVKYDTIARGFKGISNGETFAVISYLGLSDTIYFVVGRCMSGINNAAIDTSGNTTFCSSNSITLTAGSGMSEYLWSNGATTPSIDVTTTGSYSVITIDSLGCSAISQIISVTVNPIPPTPTITAGAATTFCSGGSITLRSNAVSGNQWYKDGVAISGSTDTTLNITASGSYTVKESANGCESAASNAIVVTVNPIPSTPAITAGTATTFCQGGSVTLTSNASNGHQWYKDGVAISGSINSTLTVTTTGSYTVKVTVNGCESAASTAILVTVNPIPSTAAITAGTATTFCQGGSVILTSNASSGNQWYKDGVAISGSTGTTLNVTISGSYTVKATINSCESAVSNPITVTVNPIPPTPTITQSVNDLVSSAVSGNQWYLNNAIIAGAIGQNYLPTASGNYTVQVTMNNCASTFSGVFPYIVTSVPNIDVFGNHVKVLPNPVKDKLIIIRSDQVSLLNIRLFDINGKQLKTFTSSLSRTEIDMTKYASGAYIVWIEDRTRKIIGQKVIIKL